MFALAGISPDLVALVLMRSTALRISNSTRLLLAVGSILAAGGSLCSRLASAECTDTGPDGSSTLGEVAKTSAVSAADVIQAIQKSAWSSGYDQSVESSIDDSELSKLDRASDMARFCPRYSELSPDHRKLVWADLLHAMAYAESEYKVEDTYKDSNFSVGLLQISYSDEKAHGCAFKNELGRVKSYSKLLAIRKQLRSEKIKQPDTFMDRIEDSIFDPRANLACGIKILSDQISKSGCNSKIVCNKSYWAVLRTNRPGHRTFIQGWDNLIKYGDSTLAECGSQKLNAPSGSGGSHKKRRRRRR